MSTPILIALLLSLLVGVVRLDSEYSAAVQIGQVIGAPLGLVILSAVITTPIWLLAKGVDRALHKQWSTSWWHTVEVVWIGLAALLLVGQLLMWILGSDKGG
ncbi:MAG: hypothetical protein ACYSTG_10435 [Planctomycetota bacterium]|jgi:hypothetical protein